MVSMIYILTAFVAVTMAAPATQPPVLGICVNKDTNRKNGKASVGCCAGVNASANDNGQWDSRGNGNCAILAGRVDYYSECCSQSNTRYSATLE